MVRMTAPPHPEMGSYPPDSSLFRGPGSEKREHTNCTEQTHKVSNPQVSGLRSQNMLSGSKFFAKGFLPRPASSIPNT